MEDIGTAIMHGAAAGKLRAYVRKFRESGEGEGLAGFIRLADRHSAAATAALNKAAGNATGSVPRLACVGDAVRQRTCF